MAHDFKEDEKGDQVVDEGALQVFVVSDLFKGKTEPENRNFVNTEWYDLLKDEFDEGSWNFRFKVLSTDKWIEKGMPIMV